jgi:hypothetical protein
VIYWTLLGFAVAIGLLILLSPYLPERADGDDGPFTTAGSNDAGPSCGDGGGSCD